MSDYWKKKLEELEQEKEAISTSYWDRKKTELAEQKTSDVWTPKKDEDIAPIATTTKKDEPLLDFFQKGSFEDGYQKGDILKAMGGNMAVSTILPLKGAAGLVEGIADAAGYILAGGADLVGADKFADKTRKFSQRNLVGELTKPVDDFIEENATAGRTIRSISETGGQVALILATGGMAAAGGMSAAGVSALTSGVMGLSGLGSGTTEAYQGGATDWEAFKHGLNTGAADAISELIFGGLGKSLNAVGFSKGLSSADDMLATLVGSKFKNQVAKNIVEFGIKAGAEGLEEVIAGIAQAYSKSRTYMSDEDFIDILKDENLLEQFVVGMAVSGISQGGDLVNANKSGTDFITGMTQTEQSVVDKEVENRIAEAEADGTKLTAKQKSAIEAQVEKALEKGYISTDLIEEVVGGDTYKSYKSYLDKETKLQKEYDTLYKMKQGDMTGEQTDRLAALKEQLAAIKDRPLSKQMKNLLDQEVSEKVNGSRLMESYNEKARRGQAFEADLSKYDKKQQAVIQKAVESGILNNTNRTHEFVDMVAKISADKGVLFDFTNNEKLKTSGFAMEGKTVNGFVTKDGVTLNVQSAKALNSVVGHEIAHVLEGTDLYTELQNAVVEYAKTKGDYQGRLDSLSKLYESVEGADINAELTADLVGDYLFTDPDFINNLSTNHRNVFQKIYDEVKYLLKVATAGSKEARELEKVKRAFEKAYRESGAQKNTADSGAKYALRKDIVDVNGREYDSVVELDKTVSQRTLSEPKRFMNYIVKNFVGLRIPVTDAFGNTEIIEFAGTDETVTKNKKRHPALGELAYTKGDTRKRVIVNAQEVIQESMYDPEYSSTDNEHGWLDKNGWESRKTYVLTQDGKIYEAYLKIAKTQDGRNLLYAVNLDINKGIAVDQGATSKKAAVLAAMPSGDMVAQEDDSVKSQYSLSEDVQAAEKYFGTTYKIKEAGYLLTNGKFLDFSGKHDGAPGGYRTVDHRDITDAFDGEYGDGSYSGGMIQFISAGNIRLSPEIGGINLSVKPTKEQIAALDRYITSFRGEVILDIDNEKGVTLVSVEYPARTYSKRIINDINAYFDNGTIPEPPTSMGQFRYSLSDAPINEVTEDGLTMTYVRVPNQNTPYYGSTYGQNIEPAGEYMSMDTMQGRNKIEGYEYGTIQFKKPLVLEHINTGDTGWKKTVSDMYGGLTGKELTKALLKDGYDAIVTYDDYGYSEIVNLNGKKLSLSNEGESPVRHGSYNVYGKDIALEAPVQEEVAPTVSEMESVAPVAISETETTTEDSTAVEDLFPDDLAPVEIELDNLYQQKTALEGRMTEAMNGEDLDGFTQANTEYDEVMTRIEALEGEISERTGSLDDADVPPEMEAPYPGETSGSASVPDPFADRDMFEVGKRKVKAYQFENPEVRPFFREAAIGMLDDLHRTTKGEKIFNGDVYYQTGGEKGWDGTKRSTTADIAALLDEWHYTYAQIEEGLNDIIEDHGKENNAVSKRIEFMLDDRLRNGYTDVWGEPMPANQEYINFLKEKQITEYSKEAFDRFMETADRYAPPAEDIAPMKPERSEQMKLPLYHDPNKVSPAMGEVQTDGDIAPVFESEGGQQAIFEPVTMENAASTRKALHAKIMDNIKTSFAEKGFDLDAVLKNAKNLSTFATVDNTPQRVMEKALGYKEGGILSDITVNQVAQNETAGIVWLNKQINTIKEISKQYHIKPGSKESAAAQMYAEGFYVNGQNEIIRYGDAELAADFPDMVKQAQIKGLARDSRIRKIYDDTLKAINESRTRNAYPEIPRLDNYFLHFRAMNDTFSKLGLPFNPNDIRAKDLPTDLNGVTADLKPGQPFFASAMHREGKRTSFDLLGGLEQYLNSAKNQIYHIDDIQTLRALRNYVADTYGQANGLEGLDMLSEEEQQQRIEQVYNSHLSTFAKFLNEEANVLAGKTALIDRGVEGIIGRRGITFLDTVNKQVGKNMVGFNVSSSLTNFLPVVQTFAKTNKFDFVKALAQTTASKLKALHGETDSFVENNPTIIRRKGAEKFSRTPYEKISDAGYVLMSAVDDISTEIIVRAKYNELTRKGMSEQKAAFETDKWVSRLMGDRSLGQQPQLYNSKMLGLLTKFQLEVRNQLDSQFYDTIQEAKVSNEDIENRLLRNAKTAAKVGSTFFQLAVAQHVFGKAFESVAGYNPAFDIIEALVTAFGWDDDEEDEDTVLDNIEQGFLVLLEDLPYTSTFTGGRIPISSALPVKQLITGKDQYGNEKSRLETLAEVAPYYVAPGGYGQVKKTVAGLKMFSNEHPIAGSYTDSGNLRFTVEDTLANRAQAAIFGQWASSNARDYFDNERKALTPKQTQELVDVGISIQDYWEYREGLSGLSTLEQKLFYIDSLNLTTAQKNVLANNLTDRQEAIDMTDYDKFGSLSEFDYANDNPEKYAFFGKIGITYEQYQNADDDAKDAYDWAFKNPEKYTLSKAVAGDVVEYRKYASDLYDIKADKDEDGKSISGSRKEKVINYINSLDIDYGAKLILFKNEYNSDNESNYEIIEYLNNREDISFEEEVMILRELGFTVTDDGTIYWD